MSLKSTGGGCPAAAVRLPVTVDAGRMVDELGLLTAERWRQQRVFGAYLSSSPTDADWRILPLRSPDGSLERTDPGGPGADDFADTAWLDRMPYIRSLMQAIPASLRAVRLMALGPGAVSPTHCDLKYGPRWGLARIHLPIVTNPGAILDIQGTQYCWQPGEVWFGDFTRPHHIHNSGRETRVHLVVDCVVGSELARYFPAAWRAYLESNEVLRGRAEQPRQWSGVEAEVRHVFNVPTRFLDWREPGDLSVDAAESRTVVTAIQRPGAVELVLPDERRVNLVHVTKNEFRFAGWTQERTIVLPGSGPDDGSVILRTREGGHVWELSIASVVDSGRSQVPATY